MRRTEPHAGIAIETFFADDLFVVVCCATWDIYSGFLGQEEARIDFFQYVAVGKTVLERRYFHDEDTARIISLNVVYNRTLYDQGRDLLSVIFEVTKGLG